MELQVERLKEGDYLPARYSSDGENVSPEVHWSGVPEGTRELALIFEKAPFVQWLVYRIPPDAEGLPEGLRDKADPEDPPALVQGTNSRGNVGYDGPLSTISRRYDMAFHLYALDSPVQLDSGADKAAFLKAIDHHVLAEAEQHINYQRPS